MQILYLTASVKKAQNVHRDNEAQMRACAYACTGPQRWIMIKRALIGALLVLLTAAISNADTLGLDLTSGDISDVGSFPNVGWSFTVNSPIVVTGLGMFDYSLPSPGLVDTHTVGLWGSGTLLAQATITVSSTQVASAASFGQWLFADIAPVELGLGTYVLGAFYPTAADFVVVNADITTAPEITYVTSLASNSSSFGEPGPYGLDMPGVFGPDLEFGAVPEPAAIYLLGTVAALLGLCLARSRRRA